MKTALAIAGILFLSTSIYFACLKSYKYSEVRYMEVLLEQSNKGDTMTGPVTVEVTKDFKQLSSIFLTLGILDILLLGIIINNKKSTFQ